MKETWTELIDSDIVTQASTIGGREGVATPILWDGGRGWVVRSALYIN